MGAALPSFSGKPRMGTSTPAMFTVEGCCSIGAAASMASGWCSLLGSLDAGAVSQLACDYSISYSLLAVVRGLRRRSREDNRACVCETLASAPKTRVGVCGDSAGGGRDLDESSFLPETGGHRAQHLAALGILACQRLASGPNQLFRTWECCFQLLCVRGPT